jgi:hypothetical protein
MFFIYRRQYKRIMDINKVKRTFKKVLTELKKTGAARVNKSDITTFFTTSSRGDNDAANKKRENVLASLLTVPTDYLTDAAHGAQWRTVRDDWIRVLKAFTPDPEKEATAKLMGGRKYNYDIDLFIKTNNNKHKIEFKYGGSKITELPQFLSLQAKAPLFPLTFPQFYYEKYIDRYIAADTGLTAPKPPLAEYLDMVTKVNYDVNPFFAQLKEREDVNKAQKDKIVNDGITDYLNQYGSKIDAAAFTEKVKETQRDKVYIMWSGGKFNVDQLDTENLNFEFHQIRNGNLLEVKSGDLICSMLLRWRNHKGILKPAWQISLKRV